jgi:hypothetical protein
MTAFSHTKPRDCVLTPKTALEDPTIADLRFGLSRGAMQRQKPALCPKHISYGFAASPSYRA